MRYQFRTSFSAALLICMLCGAVGAIAQQAKSTDSQKVHFSIPRQDLQSALNEFALQSRRDVLFSPEIALSKRSTALLGDYDVLTAIQLLLSGTGLTFRTPDDRTILVDPAAGSLPRTSLRSDDGVRVAQVDQASTGPQVVSSEERKKEEPALTEIVVTGTHIRGAVPLSPVKTITHQDLADQGYTRLDDAIQQLPENFGDGSSVQSNGTLGFGPSATSNPSFGTGVNLFGLGVGTTLVLLNGQRLAPTGQGSHVDISGIPTSAIERVEIVEDGASAIYGADAVGGVVNIITRKDFDGVETGARVTNVSRGKTPNYGGYALAGTEWNTGNVVVNFDYEKDNPLLADSRSFTSGLLEPTYLFPQNENYRFYMAARQSLTSDLTLAAQAMVPYRKYSSLSNDGDLGLVTQEGSELQPSFSTELTYDFAPGWQASVSGSFSEDRLQFTQDLGALSEDANGEQRVKSTTAEASISGPVFNLPAGAAQLAMGVQIRSESFLYTYNVAFPGVFFSEPTEAGSRHQNSAYGELLLPLVGEDMGIPLVRELALDAAGRFDHYSDFGSSTNPKVTLKWIPIPGLSIHGTYTTSFRAPTFDELLQERIIEVYPETDPASPTGISRALLLDGGNPNLGPERSKSFSTGLAYSPPSATGFGGSLSYFHFDYTQRIERLELVAPWGLGGFLANSTALGPLITLNPTSAEITGAYASVPPANIYDVYTFPPGTPSTIAAIAQVGYQNAAVSIVSGVNGNLHYLTKTAIGDLTATIDGTYLTKSEQQIAPNSQAYTLLNTIGGPLKFRSKGMLSWKWRELAAYGRVNYANAYRNGGDLSCGPSGCPIASWTTFDTGFSYSTPPSVDHRLLSGLRIGLDVVNVFNREPPYALTPGPYGSLTYDPINANPLQRAFSLTVTKKW